jgi:16S rRNA C967 or C1407 C5-methylase (RsmB/RsmF family)/NOL1/NOP2/fmu family ribosome biogenesis protein
METYRGSTLPRFFAERMEQQLGEGIHDFINSLQQESPVSVRFHAYREKVNLSNDKVPWCSGGYYLPERPLFTADPWFHGGAYYVQESGSMFLEQAFKAIHLPSPVLVLDLCAAPGGKTTHLLSLLQNDDLLVSNEVIRGRSAVLLENVQKWGYPNVVVTQNDPEDFGRLRPLFDLIVADVPCSGEGLFRKDPASITEWSPGNTALCAARQKRILAEAWKCLKPGGYLIYSTCTYNPGENEMNLQWLSEQTDAIPIEFETNPEWNVRLVRYKNISGYQFYPHLTRSEGFFLGIVNKRGTLSPLVPGRTIQKLWFPVNNQIGGILRKWILPDFDVTFLGINDEYILFPETWIPNLSILGKNLNLLQVGTPVASGKKGNIIPHPAFAHSILLDTSAFTEIPLGLKEAIRYLRKDIWEIEHTAREWMIASYKNVPLGWMKNVGTRFNNYFPKERRIRMQIKEIPLPWYE